MKQDREWKRFVTHARKTVKQMQDSAVTLVIGPDILNPPDIDFLLQIGASVLMEKPLLVVVPEGRTLPPKLERIADRVIVADYKDGERIQEAIKRFMTDFGLQ